jgi:hypothetical protein
VQSPRPAPPSAPPEILEVRIRGIDLPFDELLLLTLKLMGVQAVLAALVGLALYVIGVI